MDKHQCSSEAVNVGNFIFLCQKPPFTYLGTTEKSPNCIGMKGGWEGSREDGSEGGRVGWMEGWRQGGREEVRRGLDRGVIKR